MRGSWCFFLLSSLLFSCVLCTVKFRFDNDAYLEIAKKAMEANEVLLKDVMSRKCRLSVDFRRGELSFSPSIGHIEPDRFGRTVTPGRVCTVHLGDQNKPALLTAVDQISELDHGIEGWQNFLNKASYAVQHDHSFYLWIGRLPKESRETFISDRDTFKMPWYKCAELRNPLDGVSMYKILAILALFDSPHPPAKVLFLDNRMFFPLKSQYQLLYDVEQNFDDPSVFFIGDSGGEGGRMTAGMLGVKNTIETKRFLSLWWQLQCGLRDEHSLYMMLFYYSLSRWGITIRDDHMKAMGLGNFDLSNQGANAYFEIKKYLFDIRNSTNCQNSQRTVITKTPHPDHPFFPLHHQLFVEDPLCGVVASISQQNGLCQCKIGECEGLCVDRWSQSEAKQFTGKELQFEQSWFLSSSDHRRRTHF